LHSGQLAKGIGVTFGMGVETGLGHFVLDGVPILTWKLKILRHYGS